MNTICVVISPAWFPWCFIIIKQKQQLKHCEVTSGSIKFRLFLYKPVIIHQSEAPSSLT